MSEKSENRPLQKSEAVGKLVFYVSLVAMLVFFWWLLIYDHGIVSSH